MENKLHRLMHMLQFPFIVHSIKTAIDVAFEKHFIIKDQSRDLVFRNRHFNNMNSIFEENYNWSFYPERIDVDFIGPNRIKNCLTMINIEQEIVMTPVIKPNTFEKYVDLCNNFVKPFVSIVPSFNFYIMKLNEDPGYNELGLLFDPIAHFNIYSNLNQDGDYKDYKFGNDIYYKRFRVYFPWIGREYAKPLELKHPIKQDLPSFNHQYFYRRDYELYISLEVPTLLREPFDNRIFSNLDDKIESGIWWINSTLFKNVIDEQALKDIDKYFTTHRSLDNWYPNTKCIVSDTVRFFNVMDTWVKSMHELWRMWENE